MTDTQILNAIDARRAGRFDDPDLMRIGPLDINPEEDYSTLLALRSKEPSASPFSPRELAFVVGALRIAQYASDDAIDAVPEDKWKGFARLHDAEIDSLCERLSAAKPKGVCTCGHPGEDWAGDHLDSCAIFLKPESVNADILTALKNMIAMAKPHFSDTPQMLCLSLAKNAVDRAEACK